MRRLSLRNGIIPLALLALVMLTYGLFIPFLGLYGDDWPYLWVRHVFGAQGYSNFVAWDRPFSAFIYLLATPILGEQPWAYHLFLALLRWGDAVLLWWLLRLAWPEHRLAAVSAAFLFVVYPGFLQQPVPLEFMLHFSVLGLLLMSLGTMLLATRQERRWQVLALTFLALLGESGMFALEYFVGLELLRPVFLWAVLARQEKNRRRLAGRVLLRWLPYLLVLLAYLVWRVFVFKFPTYQPGFLQGLASSPLAALLELARRVLVDLQTVTLGAWANSLHWSGGRRTWLLSGGLLVLSALLTVGVFWLARKLNLNLDDQRRSWAVYLLAGLAALLVGGIPFWVTGLPVTTSFPWDRSTLAFLVGASLFAAGLISILQPRLRPIALALLVGLAVGFQARNALSYRTESEKLRAYFWQMTWRAPGLKPGTIVLSERIPLYYYGDNGLTPPLNWTYAPEQKGSQLAYNFFDVDERLGGVLPALEKNLPIQRGYRSFSFKGSSSNILLVSQQPGGCLHVLSEADAGTPGLPPKIAGALALSNLGQIVLDANPPAEPPRHVLGAEPDYGWCYYYEKAGLALQRGDWQAVAMLGDQAQAGSLSPSDLSEWLPFIEGYARSGRLEEAALLSEQVGQQSNLRPLLCGLWQRTAQDVPAAVSAVGSLKCDL